MKNLFVFIFLASTLSLLGQDLNPTQKGNRMLGGSGSIAYFTQFEENSYSFFSINLNPSIGWFLSDGFALGVAPTLYVGNILSKNGDPYLGIGSDVFVAKYFGNGVFIKGSTGYVLSHSFDSSENNNDHSDHSIRIIPEFGYAFFLGPNVALELALTNVLDIRLSNGSTSFYNYSMVKAGFQIFL